MRGFTLDTSALIALERAEERVVALLSRARATPDAVIHIPAGVLAQAFRDGARQVQLARLMKHSGTSVVPLDANAAQIIGLLLSARGTEDVVDASVVVCARRYGQPVVTGDARDLHRLDPKLALEVI
ncbi:MAG TPA: PIN domain-containing protein [Solirubrobacteraceae bacterium]|nr:PIN domain-containing protein [Solirubrobacteraceae bacterium]